MEIFFFQLQHNCNCCQFEDPITRISSHHIQYPVHTHQPINFKTEDICEDEDNPEDGTDD